MEAQKKPLKSIWGRWWEPIRKWFYPAWLIYETSIRFYEYALGVHYYLVSQQDILVPYIGNIGTQILDVFSSGVTFIVCTAFLTLPGCFTLYKFFKLDNLSGSQFEAKLKFYF